MDEKKKKRVEKETGLEDGKDGVIEGLEQEEKDGGIGRKTGWMEGWIRKKRVDGRKQRRDQEKEVMQEAQREKEGWVEI